MHNLNIKFIASQSKINEFNFSTLCNDTYISWKYNTGLPMKLQKQWNLLNIVNAKLISTTFKFLDYKILNFFSRVVCRIVIKHSWTSCFYEQLLSFSYITGKRYIKKFCKLFTIICNSESKYVTRILLIAITLLS